MRVYFLDKASCGITRRFARRFNLLEIKSNLVRYIVLPYMHFDA